MALALVSSLFIVFGVSSGLRAMVALWFWARAVESRLRRRPRFLQLIFRVSRFNAITGVSLDWLSVTRRDKAGLEPESKQSNDEVRARDSDGSV